MSTASCALPERRTIGPRRRGRVGRVARLLAHLVRMWLGAHLLVPRLGDAQRRRLVRRWSGALLAALRVEVQARGHLPRRDEPALFVANHVSWLDSYAVSTVAPARFVAKSEVATWPMIGVLASRFGSIFIKRGCVRSAARTVGALAQALHGGDAVAAFPESTTSDGRTLLPFYPAMFQSAVLTGVPIRPVALRYRDQHGAPSTAAAFVGEMSILDSLRQMLREPRLRVDVIFCAPIDPVGRTRRELAALARAAIADALDLAAEDVPLRRAA